MFHIKICGVQRPADIQAVEMSGADAIGLNFFQPSVRYVDPNSPKTHELSGLASAAGLLRVGVFVNEPHKRMVDIASEVGLDAIQLHGDEQIDVASRLHDTTGLQVIRAIKLLTSETDPAEICAKADRWVEAGCHLLLDADAGAAHGGSGKTLYWPSVRQWADQRPDVTWTLAGGLTAGNVAEAIRVSGAKSVDTASGVEEPRGLKSSRLIQRFVVESRSALLA
jgi:phosphoribosylanthranilate isomerase